MFLIKRNLQSHWLLNALLLIKKPIKQILDYFD